MLYLTFFSYLLPAFFMKRSSYFLYLRRVCKHLSGKLVSRKCNLYKVFQLKRSLHPVYMTMYNAKTCKKVFDLYND